MPPSGLAYQTILVEPPATNANRLVRIVDPGETIFAVLVEALGVPPLALVFGNSGAHPVRVQTGDVFNFGQKPLHGLWALWPKVNYDAHLVVTVFFEPIDNLVAPRADIWAHASKYGSNLTVNAGAAERAGLTLANYDPQSAGAAVAGIDPDQSPRLVKLDQLVISPDIATTIRVTPCAADGFAGAPAAVGDTWSHPVMLGVTPGARLVGGVDPVLPGGADPEYFIPVAAGGVLALSDLDADISSAFGMLVRAEELNVTLNVTARWREVMLEYAKG